MIMHAIYKTNKLKVWLVEMVQVIRVFVDRDTLIGNILSVCLSVCLCKILPLETPFEIELFGVIVTLIEDIALILLK
jgi:hypothetical protein